MDVLVESPTGSPGPNGPENGPVKETKSPETLVKTSPLSLTTLVTAAGSSPRSLNVTAPNTSIEPQAVGPMKPPCAAQPAGLAVFVACKTEITRMTFLTDER